MRLFKVKGAKVKGAENKDFLTFSKIGIFQLNFHIFSENKLKSRSNLTPWQILSRIGYQKFFNY